MEQLRAAVLQDIAMHEKVAAYFKRILKQLTIVYIVEGLILISMIGFLIYINTHPVGALDKAIKSLDYQRKAVEEDRKDVAIARAQLVDLIRVQDSIQNRRDSILKIKK